MKFSIITINYNNKAGLRKTIESVVNQTCKDYEYIVIDGGSTDGSVDVIREYEYHIDYWISEPDKGIYNAMNKGILKAKGEYLNFMNSGDCFYNEFVLDNSFSYLKEDIVVGRLHRSGVTNTWNYYDEEITMMLFFNGSLPHPASFIKRILFQDSLYDENYKIVSDWKFFIEKLIFENCSFKNISVDVVLFDNTGISTTNVELMEKERTQVLSSMFPERVLMDYEKLKNKESPVLYLIPQFNKTYRLHKFIVSVIKFILSVSKIANKYCVFAS